ncbi:hypothetical protein [Flavobacterium sp. LC2016-13]|uniref:hypothetical protein n=1 Tax=Flavobacterium sp. LC2016-13 TaxID=2675875 RepID=UPI0012B76C05|nr:hypothetical protein [Flavobacterium sp. LC2016-13]MTD72296.1 hypothetical protein [Flavobacterium sp. LC2016-13]
MKRKVKYIKEFAVNIENYDPSLQHKINSLQADYIQVGDSVEFGNKFIFIILNPSKNECQRSLLSKVYYSAGSIF